MGIDNNSPNDIERFQDRSAGGAIGGDSRPSTFGQNAEGSQGAGFAQGHQRPEGAEGRAREPLYERDGAPAAQDQSLPRSTAAEQAHVNNNAAGNAQGGQGAQATGSQPSSAQGGSGTPGVTPQQGGGGGSGQWIGGDSQGGRAQGGAAGSGGAEGSGRYGDPIGTGEDSGSLDDADRGDSGLAGNHSMGTNDTGQPAGGDPAGGGMGVGSGAAGGGSGTLGSSAMGGVTGEEGGTLAGDAVGAASGSAMFDEGRDGRQLAEHMEVCDSSGQPVGVIDHVEGSRIKLTRRDSADGRHHYIEASDIETIEEGRAILREGASIPSGAQ